MEKINSKKSSDLISDCLYIKAMGYKNLVNIKYDSELERLLYVFSNHRNSFFKLFFSLSEKASNLSITSIYKKAKFFEIKLSNSFGIHFSYEEDETHYNASFEESFCKQSFLVEEGRILKSHIEYDFPFKESFFLSFDDMLSDLDNEDRFNFSSQILALLAVEKELGLKLGHSQTNTRMILLELDNIKYLLGFFIRFCEQKKLKGMGTSFESLRTKVLSFIRSNVKAHKLISSQESPISEKFFFEYEEIQSECLNLLKKMKRKLLKNPLNALDLRGIKLEPRNDEGQKFSGVLSQCLGNNLSFKRENDFMFYKQLGFSGRVSNSSDLFTLLDFSFSALEKSLSDIETILLNTQSFSPSGFNLASYDLTELEDCFYELETVYGMMGIHIYKNESNQLKYSLDTEALSRLFIFEEIHEQYDISFLPDLGKLLDFQDNLIIK